MKILYDHQIFTIQNFGGISKCFCEYIKHRPAGVEYEIATIESNNEHLRCSGLIPDLRPISWTTKNDFCRKHFFRGNTRLFDLLNLLPWKNSAEKINGRESEKALKKGDFDVFHPTFFDDYYMPYLQGKPFVLTIYDMMPELFPQYFGANNFQIVQKRKLVKQADIIIAISQHTKDDVVRILGVPEEKVKVVYLGGPEREDIKEPALVNEPYFLYMGTRNDYKNFNQTLVDFAKFTNSHPTVKLVCTGAPFTQSELVDIKNFGLSNHVIHKRASDSEVKNLYAHAIAFIYPSLYEGFGMPILEAFAYGCPALLNNKSCFPEIAGDAALYFDSQEGKSDLPLVMERLINFSQEERTALVEKGYERLKLFSWEKLSAQLCQIYQSLIKK